MTLPDRRNRPRVRPSLALAAAVPLAVGGCAATGQGVPMGLVSAMTYAGMLFGVFMPMALSRRAK